MEKVINEGENRMLSLRTPTYLFQVFFQYFHRLKWFISKIFGTTQPEN